MFTAADYIYMQQAITLAKRGMRRTWPNPMVGAVVVKKGRVVGRGWHWKYGCRHAEINALRQAGVKARGAILYVSLEPCNHYGNTPPCTQALIKAGISRVICAMQDPNPKVSGQGIACLRRAGISVSAGLLSDQAREVNKVYIKLVTRQLPYVINKMALSLDGKIACYTGESRWITNLAARKYTHRLRAAASAVLVGARTVLADNPELSVRLAANKSFYQPARIVLAGKRRLPHNLKIFKTCKQQRLVIVEGDRTARARNYPDAVEHWILPEKRGRVDIHALLKKMFVAGMYSLLVEGGAEVHASFLGLDAYAAKVYSDEVQMVFAPKIIGGRGALSSVGGKGAGHPDQALNLRDISWRSLGEDMLVTGHPERQKIVIARSPEPVLVQDDESISK